MTKTWEKISELLPTIIYTDLFLTHKTKYFGHTQVAELNVLIKELQTENIELYSKISVHEKSSNHKDDEIIRLQQHYHARASGTHTSEDNARREEVGEEVVALKESVLKLSGEKEMLERKLKMLEQREDDMKNDVNNLQKELSESVKKVDNCFDIYIYIYIYA